MVANQQEGKSTIHKKLPPLPKRQTKKLKMLSQKNCLTFMTRQQAKTLLLLKVLF